MSIDMVEMRVLILMWTQSLPREIKERYYEMQSADLTRWVDDDDGGDNNYIDDDDDEYGDDDDDDEDGTDTKMVKR